MSILMGLWDDKCKKCFANSWECKCSTQSTSPNLQVEVKTQSSQPIGVVEVKPEPINYINNVVLGDNVATMKRLPANCIDLTVTSPPYDNLRNYQGFTFDYKVVIDELYRITKEGGVVVWVVADATKDGTESGTSFRQALYFMQVGFNLHDTMIYDKLNYPPLTHRRYEQEWEYMFVFSKGPPKTFNPIMVDTKNAGKGHNWARPGITSDNQAGRIRNETTIIKDKKIKGNVWSYVTGKRQEDFQIDHPAVFPYELAEDHIKSWSNEGDLIFDPFGGSGTTLKAAKNNGRKYFGTEIGQKYYDIIMKRLSDESSE